MMRSARPGSSNDIARRQTLGSGSTDLYALRDTMNVVVLVNTSGAVQQRMAYDAFGTTRFLTSAFASGSNATNWNTLFHAHYREAETGLYQMRFRCYHPLLEMMLIDADNHPVRDPSFLFESGPYQETGALFWPELGRLGPERAIWSICDVEYRDEPEFESGQMVVNKARCWRELQLTMHLNEHSDFYYQQIHGDKDTFHMAWRMLETPYGMVPHPVTRMRGGLVQADMEGARLFQPRAGGAKWKARGNTPIPGYVHWDRCVAHLEALELPPDLAPACAPCHTEAQNVNQRLARYGSLLGSRHQTMKEALLRLAASPHRCVVELGITQSFVSGGRPGCCSPDTAFWKPERPESWDCGAGFFTRVALECLQGLVFSYRGIDPNPSAHTIATAACAGLRGDIVFHQTMAEGFLSTWEGRADLVYFDHGESSEETAMMHARDAATVIWFCPADWCSWMITSRQVAFRRRSTRCHSFWKQAGKFSRRAARCC